MERVRAGQRVRVEGRDPVFVILRLDRQRHLADLLYEGAVRRIECGVPLVLLRSADDAEAVGDVKVPA